MTMMMRANTMKTIINYILLVSSGKGAQITEESLTQMGKVGYGAEAK